MKVTDTKFLILEGAALFLAFWVFHAIAQAAVEIDAPESASSRTAGDEQEQKSAKQE